MASRLTEQDKILLNAYQTKRVGEKPYEDGLWGSQGNKDFAYLEIYDDSHNLIDFKNFTTDKFSINHTNNNIQLYIGDHLRELGFNNGIFNVNYRFFRKLAGDETAVLIRNKAGFEGDVHTGPFNIQPDGKVYIGTEEAFRDSPGTAEQLGIEDLKYQIDEISPNRTEVRLKAKNIKGPYTDEFIDIQTAVSVADVDGNINFVEPGGDADAVYESNVLTISPDIDGFLFTQKMKFGTIIIPGVFLVNEVQIPVKTGINFVENGDFETTEMDSLGNETSLANSYAWDASLHSKAIKAIDWSPGFNNFGRPGAFQNTAHIGYHAHFIRGEGVTGGVCMKFPDQNQIFTELDEWPSEYPSRWMGINQKMGTLIGQGVKHFDLVNLTFDLKASVAGRGVLISLYYPNELVTEEMPTAPPTGYFDPNYPPPSELPPTYDPPGYTANTPANAEEIEQQPPSKHSLILAMYDLTFYDGAVGDDTNDGDMIQGAGAWIITSYTQGTIPGSPGLYQWSPNLVGPQYSGVGSLSDEGEWMWDGSAWVVNPDFNNPYPTPPFNTVNTLEFPDAVNAHPYQLEGQGTAKFPRHTYPGENRGWQTGTVLFADDDKLTSICGIPEDYINNDAVMLIKDDLVWVTPYKFTANRERVGLTDIGTMFPQLFTEQIGRVDAEGNDVGPHSMYNDIFEKGRIQSITRTQRTGTGTGNDDNRDNFFVIFYTDGRGNLDSNKVFIAEIGAGSITEFHYLKDLDSNYNETLNNNGGHHEWVFSGEGRSGGEWHHYSSIKGTNIRWLLKDGDGNLFELNNDGELFSDDNDSGEASSFSNNMAGIDGNYLDIWFSAHKGGSHWSNYSGIYGVDAENGGQWVNMKNTESDGVQERGAVNVTFYGAGEVNNSGAALSYGSRNPGADNYGRHNADGTITPMDEPIYDNGNSSFSYDPNPTKDGTLSSAGLWIWDGAQALWNQYIIAPPRYSYAHQYQFVPTDAAGVWETKNTDIMIPNDWILDQDWYVYFYGHIRSNGNQEMGISWVDNIYMDFTLVDQSVTQEVYRPYSAQIQEVSANGLTVTLDRSYKQNAMDIGVGDEDPDTEVYDISNPPNSGYSNFRVTYLNLNPLDLRTYLKFNNQLFLTTNFKQDKLNVTNFPHAVVYKLYEPLPEVLSEFAECIVVKEMAEPLVEKIKILDFIPAEEGKLVLKSPDLKNVESPIRARKTDFKNENEILTDDATISSALKNEFLSQSMDSVDLNIEHGRYENFVKFSSAEKRIRNFKLKLKQIEDYGTISSSFEGVSGSSAAVNAAEVSMIELKNGFDQFEEYMYYESSSYSSGSLGIFYDNAWPKASGNGTLNSPYVLETSTSTNGINWFNLSTKSGSLYDEENRNKLSSLLPTHIVENVENDVFLRFTDMIGQHFDSIWVYINAITDTFDRREKLTEGVSKDLLYSVARSLGWTLDDGKDLVDLPRYALGKEVTGSAYSDYSAVAERDISREIWSRIINNMPFFLKNKGTVRALKGLINVYGIPSTILRVKEYGGPDLPDDASPQFEITRKFTKALDFRGSQYVKLAWTDDSDSGRKPDTIEFRFRSVSSSNQILLNKGTESGNENGFILRLKDNGSSDNYGSVEFMLSGSGGFETIESTEFPVYDGDFYSVMLARKSGSDNTHVTQSYELNVGKYDSSRSKIHLFSSTTMDETAFAISGGFNGNYTASAQIFIGGGNTYSSSRDGTIGSPLTGSIMEYRHWTETLNTASFKNHIANPKAYDGNTISSSYSNLVLRYSFDDNKDLTSDTEGIRDVSSNQTTTLSGSHYGFTGNFYSSVVDEQKSFIPSIGALRRTTNKIRIEDNPLKSGEILSPEKRSTKNAFDSAPLDSNKVGIFFAPTDVINRDIIDSVGNLNFDNYLGDPRDQLLYSYRGLERVSDNYWKKYTDSNNFWDYIRMIKYYDQSMYTQLRKMIPARAKPDIGLLIEPNIFERPKTVIGKTPDAESRYFSSSIDIGNVVDGLIVTSGSFNAGAPISDYNAYDGRIPIWTYATESAVISSSGENLYKEATGSSVRDHFIERRMWQRLNDGGGTLGATRDPYYATASITFGDMHYSEVFQPVISGSRIFGRNQKTMPHYSSSLSASLFIAYSSSYYNVDLDNQVEEATALFNRTYAGVKNTKKTTVDGAPPVEIIITAPSKLVSVKDGESTLVTGEGIVSEFKDLEPTKDKFDPKIIEDPKSFVAEPKIPGKPQGKPTPMNPKGKLRGLKGLSKQKVGTPEKPITDAMIIREKQEKDRKAIAETSKFESTEKGKGKTEKTTTNKTSKSSKGKSKGKK